MIAADARLRAVRARQARQGRAAGVEDAAAGRRNRLGVAGDPFRFTETDAYCQAYDAGYAWKAHGPGRFVD